jgi:putative ABC transport system ATP-binding protein
MPGIGFSGNRDKILELIGISATNRAGIGVFRGLDFSLESGEAAIIIGPSASGKTTLAELIIGIMKPESGRIEVFGKGVKPGNDRYMSDIRRRIGGVGGVFDLIPNRTIMENLLYPLILRGDSRREQKARLNQILAQYNLIGRRREKASKLTRGEKALALLARAVIADQPLLIIDEPLDRLDENISEYIINILKRLSAAGHSMIILTNGMIPIDIPGARTYQLTGGRLR